MIKKPKKISLYNYEISEALTPNEAVAVGVADEDDRMLAILQKKYEQCVTENPEKVGASMWNCEKFGLDKDVVDRTVLGAAEYHKRKALSAKGSPDWDFLIKTTPETAKFFKNYDVMRAANDDVFALAEKEKELKRTNAVLNRLNSVRKKHGRAAKVNALVTLPENQYLNTNKSIFESAGEAIKESSVMKGIAAGREMTKLGRDAVALQAAKGSSAVKDWIDLEGRLYNLDSEKPDGFISGMLYETGKVVGQQLGDGAYRTIAMGATGAGLAAYAGGIGAGAVIGAPVVAGLALTAAAGWALGTKLGTFVNSAETEGGLDLISRNLMQGEDGAGLSDAQVCLGAASVGITNGILEAMQWHIAGKPFSGVIKKAIEKEAVKTLGARITERVAAIPAAKAFAEGVSRSAAKLGAEAGKFPQKEVMLRIAKDWLKTNTEESFTEVLQELAPITIDEMQKAGYLDGYDARTIGDITAELTETFTSSFYSFALMSAAGPIMGGVSGRYRVEAFKKEIEAMETRRMNRSMDRFAEKIGMTKLFKRYPSMSDAHTEQLLDRANLSKVYIKADKVQTLYQDGAAGADGYDSVTDWAEDMFGITEEEYNQSLENGSDIEIEAIKLFASLETENEDTTNMLYDAVKDDIRFRSGGMTMREASEKYKNLKEIEANDLFGVLSGFNEDAKRAESAAKVTEAIRIQLEQAGQPAEVAAANAAIGGQVYARLADAYQYALPASERKNMFVYAEDVMKRTPLIIERDGQGKVTGVSVNDNILLHPMNEGMDRNKTVTGTVVPNSLSRQDIDDAKRGTGFVDTIAGVYKNADTGWYLDLSKTNFNHAVNSAMNSNVVDFETSIKILKELPTLISRAVLIESHADTKHNDPNVTQIHRMYAPARIKNTEDVYTVKLTVKQLSDRYEVTVDNITHGRLKTYDAKVDSKTSAVAPGVPYIKNDTGDNPHAADVFEMSIYDMLKNSKDNDGKNFFQIAKRTPNVVFNASSYGSALTQNESGAARGSISLPVGLGSPVHIQTEEWESQLAHDTDAWGKEVDRILNTPHEEIKDSRALIRVMNTPLVVSLAGGNVFSGNDILGVYIEEGKISKIKHGSEHAHHLSDAQIKELPAAMADPIAVFESSDKKGKHKGITFMLEMTDENNATVISALHLNVYRKNKKLLFNKLASFYGKDKEENGQITPKDKWFKEQFDEKRLLYINEEKLRLWNLSRHLNFPGVTTSGAKNRVTTKHDLVNRRIEKNNAFYQAQGNEAARGSISLPSGLGFPVHITLGKDANASTFVHELGHFYLWNLRQMAKSDVIANRADWAGPDAQWNMDLKTVAQWWRDGADVIATEAALYANGEGVSADGFRAWLDAGMESETEAGAAYDRAAQEYFARGFEAYLYEGRAPSAELKGVFRRFKQWLCEVYRAITELDVELSDDIRNVFDRMLASEDAIARYKINERLELEIAADTENMTEEEIASIAAGTGDLEALFPDYDPYEEAKEEILKELLFGLDDEQRKAMMARAEELRPQIYFEVTSEPGYKALEMMNEMPELKLNEEAVVDTFGDTVAARMPRGSMSDDGMADLNIAAKALGFNSAQEMIDAIAGRNELSDEVNNRVKAAVQAEFADYDDDAKMDDKTEEVIHKNDDIAADAEAHGLTEEEAENLVAEAAEIEHEEDLLESEFEEILMSSEEKGEETNPLSQASVVRRIKKAEVRLDYGAIKRAYGQEAADKLKSRYGAGIFSKNGMTLDALAEQLSKDGLQIADAQGALDFLLDRREVKSAVDYAYEEGRAEVLDKYKDEFKKLKKELASQIDKTKKKNVSAAYREKYKELGDKVKADYRERVEKLKVKYAERKARLEAKAAEDKQKVKDLEVELRNKYEEKRRFRAFAEALERSAENKKKSMKSEANDRTAKGGAKIAAANTVAAMSVNQLYDVTGWLRVEKDSQAAALKCLRNMDEEGFRREWSKYLHAFFIVREMYKQRSNVEFMRSRLLKMQGRGKRTLGMSPEYCYQLDKMLARFDFGHRTVKEHKNLTSDNMNVGEAASLAEFIKEQEADGVPLLIPDWIVQTNDVRMIEALTLQEMNELYDAAVNLQHVGREDKRTTAREKNIELAWIETEILARAQEYFGKDKVDGKTNIETARNDPNKLLAFLHTLETAEAMCRSLDGFQDFGPMQDYVFRPIREAVSVENAELDRVFAAFRDLKARTVGANYKADAKKRDIGVREYERVTDPETGKATHVPNGKMSLFDGEMLLAAALNMGNEGNIARLRDGWGWSDAEMQLIRDQLTKEEWDYVQGVWDLLDSMWPQIKKVHEMMTGTTIEHVEAKPFTTKYGQTMRGGYYPIVTDLRYSVTAAAQAEREEIMASAGPLSAASKFAKNTHRKARADNVLGRPPLLALSVLDNHVANVIHDYTMSPVIRDARKILKRDVVRSVIKSVYGDQGNKIFNNWLNDIAANTKNNGIALSPVDKFANGIRANTAMFALGANIGGALMQPLGYFPLAHRIGIIKTASAIINGLIHPHETYEFARTHSRFMREQMESGGSSEIKKIRQNWTVGKGGISAASDFFIGIYPLLQNMCNVPGWVQCYKDGKNSGLSEKEAVRRADAIIRQTQSASTVADTSTIERSGPLSGLVTMFYSWFRVMYNMQTEALMKVKYEHGIDKVKDIASYAFYVLVCQSVAEALLRANGPDPDDEDEYKWAKWTARKLLLAPLSPIPGVREVAGYIENDMKYDMRVTPAQSALESVGRLIKTAYKQHERIESGDDIEWPKLTEAGATVIGYAKGMPNRKLIQAAMAFWEYFDEDKAIPWAHLILGSGYKK